MLADENNNMRDELQQQLKISNHYQFMMEEYKSAVDDEAAKS